MQDKKRQNYGFERIIPKNKSNFAYKCYWLKFVLKIKLFVNRFIKRRFKVKKTILTMISTTLLGFSVSLLGLPMQAAAESSNIEELKEQKNKLDNKRFTIKSKISDTNQEINRVKDEQAKLDKEIEKIDFAISEAEGKILQKQEEIKGTQNKIAELKEEVKVLGERIQKRNELIKDRARAFQENGSMVSYIDVLIGANSFSDFIDRVGFIATIIEADQDILRQHQTDIENLEESQKDLEEKLDSIQTMLLELEELKQNLNSQKVEKDKLMASLQLEEEEIENYKMELQEEEQLLSSQQSAIKKAIEIAKQNQAKQVSNSGESDSISASTPPVSSGTFTRPTNGILTSNFGGRSDGMHYGVDIAKRGIVPIVSAADGVVINSYYSSSYGNVVFISHSIDGQIYTTVYAHMSSRTVSAGQIVSKGQQIGFQGNTGKSFGQHLHFELHKGPWNSGKTNAINPVGIVPL